MAQRGRHGLSDSQKRDLWTRWKQGQPMSEIARALEKNHGSIHYAVALHGGIPPAERRRSRLALRLPEREEVSRGIAAGHSLRHIASMIERAPSTISREIARNGGRDGYRASAADRRAWDQARRPKRCRLALHPRLRRVVAGKLRLEWSPEQISSWLKRCYPRVEEMQISHETIYRSLFVQARGVLKKELVRHLRTRRMMRLSENAPPLGQDQGPISDPVSIRERPAEVEDRAVPGHWEGDLLSGSNNTHIATLVERKSRFTLLVKVKNRESQTVVRALTKKIRRLPTELRKSLTWDRGGEMAAHKKFSIATNAQVYFCDPRSPWQRGTNENTNRLLRQYFPKRTDLSAFTQADLNRVALRLNQRPRKTLDFRCPADVFDEFVALTG
jgi:IS30 family transposase